MEFTIGQAWQRALIQLFDTQSPFGQAKLVSAALLLLLAVMVGFRHSGEARRGQQSTLETWLACGLSILIGMNTIDAMQFTLGQMLMQLTGRSVGELSAASAVDMAIGSAMFLTCLIVWGLVGLLVMGLARGLGRVLGGLRRGAA